MKYLKQILIVLGISLLGEVLKELIPLPISASVYGLVLMFLALEFKIIKVEHVKETSNFLIEIMPFLFLPAAVGLMDTWDILKQDLVAYVVITVVTTYLVMYVAGKATQVVMKRKQSSSEQEDVQ